MEEEKDSEKQKRPLAKFGRDKFSWAEAIIGEACFWIAFVILFGIISLIV